MENVLDYAIILLDRHGLIQMWNAGAEAIFGYSADEVLGRDVSMIFTPEDRDQGMSQREMRAAEEINRGMDERWHLRKNGARFWASGILYPLLDGGGSNHGFVKIMRDFSERHRASDSLFEAEQKLEFILDSMKDYVVFMLDPQGRVATWNDGARHLLGYPEEEILGLSHSMLFTEEDTQAGAPQEDLARAEALGKKEEERWRRRKDGSLFWAAEAIMALRGKDGSLRGFVAVLRDTTQRKRSQDAQKMESIGRLAGGVAHDFNNMLTLINGYSELLLDSRDLDESARQSLEEIRRAGMRAASLTKQLLAFGRKQILEPVVFDLNGLIAAMEKLIRSTLGENNQLRTVLRPDLEQVLMDPSEMEQIILNLALNAREAMGQGGMVTLETSNRDLSDPADASALSLQPGFYVMMSFRDTGKGMDARTRANLFEPFFTSKEMGSLPIGLGMASVYGSLRQSGGTIAVDSQAGAGTEFRIYLPAAASVETSQGPDPGSRIPDLANPESILIVEDDDAVRNLTARIIRSQGLIVLEARDGEDALRLVSQGIGGIRIVLTDILMPKMGGIELARRLRLSHPELRLIFMSGYAENDLIRMEMALGSSLFLQKPFSPAQLLEKLAEARAVPASR